MTSVVTFWRSTGRQFQDQKTSRRFTQVTYQQRLFGLEDSPVKTSLLLDRRSDADSKDVNLASSLSLHDLLKHAPPQLLSSKTSQVSDLVTMDETSKSLFTRWPKSGMAWRGVCLTANISESPSHAQESSLLDAIETQEQPERYFLSPNAAQGMLRRADRMGRNLFPPLRRSLEILARGH